MWNAKAKVIPVIIWEHGTISNSLRQYPCYIPAKHKFRISKKQPYWALHTYYGKC